MNVEHSQLYYELTDWLLRRTATTGVRRVLPLEAAVATDIGNVRDENQDRAVIVRGHDGKGKSFVAVAVADGIGGMKSGATCAAMTLGAFAASLYEQAQSSLADSRQWIDIAAKSANQFVYDNFRGSGGSTLVALLLRPGHKPCWLSVGDSRVYRYRKNALIQLSVDDTIAGQLGRQDETGFEQSRLLQYVGVGSDLESNISDLDCSPQDEIILTTDGVHYLSQNDGLLARIIGNSADVGICAKRLIDIAKWCGGPDNATTAIVGISDLEKLQQTRKINCLEVWDSFGEIQVITKTIAERKVRIEADVLPVVDYLDSGEAKLELHVHAEDVPGKLSGVAAKSLKNTRKPPRKSRLQKTKQAKPKPGKTELVAPQLLVEFSKEKD